MKIINWIKKNFILKYRFFINESNQWNKEPKCQYIYQKLKGGDKNKTNCSYNKINGLNVKGG